MVTVAALGRNNCPSWPRVVGGAFMISARAPSVNVLSQISGFSPVHKVSKLPTAIHPPDAGPVTIVVQRRIGELWWGYHIVLLFHECFRQNTFELRPKVILVPILEDAFSRSLRIQTVAKVCRHHLSDGVHIVRCHRFAQARNKSIEVNISRFLARLHFRRLLFLGCLLLGRGCTTTSGEAK